MASDSQDLARRSEEDVPDPEGHWGWNGSFSRAPLAGAVVSIILLVAFTFGNQIGHIEDIWLVAIAVLLAGGLVLHFVKKRNAWRR